MRFRVRLGPRIGSIIAVPLFLLDPGRPGNEARKGLGMRLGMRLGNTWE